MYSTQASFGTYMYMYAGVINLTVIIMITQLLNNRNNNRCSHAE